jgi:hypothetical protein
MGLNEILLYLYLPEPMRPHSTAMINKVSFDSIRGSVMFKALHYTPEGSGFDSR